MIDLDDLLDVDARAFFLEDEVEIRVRGVRADVYVLPMALQVASEMWPAHFQRDGIPPTWPPAQTTMAIADGIRLGIDEHLPVEEVRLFNDWTAQIGEVPAPAGGATAPQDALTVDVVDPRRGGDPIVEQLRELAYRAADHREEALDAGNDALAEFYDGQANGLGQAIGLLEGEDGE